MTNKKTILAIEDDDTIRGLLGRLLEDYTVIAVASLSEGRKVIVERQVEIDLVLSDIQLDDGYSPSLHAEVSPIIQAHNIIWLAMTGYARDEHLHYYRSRGVQIVDKPFNRARLLEAVEEALLRPCA